MKHYFRVYKKLFKLNLESLIIYRGNFFNNIVSSSVWGIFSFVTILLLTSRTGNVFGWNQSELVFLTATYAVFIGIFHMFFTQNFSRLSQIIHFGQLDSLLVKPVDSQFLVSIWTVSFAHISRIVMGIAVMFYLIKQSGLVIYFIDILVFCLIILLSIVVMYSLWFLVMTLIIWFTRLSNLVDVMYTISSIGRFPKAIFEEVSTYLAIILLPLVLSINAPAQQLLHKPVIGDIFWLAVFALFLTVVSRKFWQFALRYYTGASA